MGPLKSQNSWDSNSKLSFQWSVWRKNTRFLEKLHLNHYWKHIILGLGPMIPSTGPPKARSISKQTASEFHLVSIPRNQADKGEKREACGREKVTVVCDYRKPKSLTKQPATNWECFCPVKCCFKKGLLHLPEVFTISALPDSKPTISVIRWEAQTLRLKEEVDHA